MTSRLSLAIRIVPLLAALSLALFVGYLDTIVTSVQAYERCSGQPSLTDDLAFIRRVQAQFRDRPKISNMMQPSEPLEPTPGWNGSKCYRTVLSQSAKWCLRPDEQLLWFGAQLVRFEGAATVECRVLRCGTFLNTLTHDPCLTMDLYD